MKPFFNIVNTGSSSLAINKDISLHTLMSLGINIWLLMLGLAKGIFRMSQMFAVRKGYESDGSFSFSPVL